MKAFNTFFHMTSQERTLVLRAVITLVSCGVRMRSQSFEQLQRWATQCGSGAARAEQLTWAIGVASRYVPGATCLSKALALQHLLSGNRHHSELKIGVDNSEGRFTAHAWLTLNDRILMGGTALENYKMLVAWSTREGLARSENLKEDQT